MNRKNSFLIFLFMLILTNISAQSSNHWTRNFNEESSLLSGAVVGGGAGAAAIFYNPATISEIEESQVSFNASLFSVDFLESKNAWGDDINLTQTRFMVIPRFVSYMIKLEKAPNLSLEVAFLNNENYRVDDVNTVDVLIDILPRFEGEERYNAFYTYGNKYRDDWLGFGGSHRVSEKLVLGVSLFLSVRSLAYTYEVDIEAGQPLFFTESAEVPFETAKYKEHDYLKFNNYRFLGKLGLTYTLDNVSLGLNITTPSLGIYADGKRVMRKRSQSNIQNENGEAIPDLFISDYADKKNVKVNFKNPLSIAVGATCSNTNNTKIVYGTLEYFTGVDAYRVAHSEQNTSMVSGVMTNQIKYDEWLTYVWGAKPVLNAALGYRWIPKDNLMVLAGFRTDFNYRKGVKYNTQLNSRIMNGFHMDRYHLTGGLTVRVLGQDLMAGLQYSFGHERDQKQFINLSDPVEFNVEDYAALQGIQKNNMTTTLHSVSLYFGATINFGSEKNKNK